MKNILIYTLLVIISFSLSNCQKKNDILYDRKYIKEIKAARKDAIFFMSSSFIPGGTFAIAKEGKIIYSEGMGTASKDLGVAADRNTKFRIGEVSELFTSLIYHKMVESGILHPDSTIKHYLSEYPENNNNISLSNLIYHSSGIRKSNQKEQNWTGINVSLQKGIDLFKNDPLLFNPGSSQEHSIFNYNLLGAIMEKASNKKFAELLEEYVTDTLQLKNTLTDNPYNIIKGRTDFYDYNLISQVVNAISKDIRFKAPSEGLLSNAEDLVIFGNALLYSDYFTEELKANLFKPVILPNNFPTRMNSGWIIMNDRNGRKIYGKSGGVTGGGAALLIYPEEKLVVACAINLSSLSEEFPVFNMAGHFLPSNKETGNTDSATDSEKK